ncbi:MAG: MoxR family ATPase, partial [Saprospiraceae bacterium]|nr:MoxR family ATPase [Saprospiraceae bacterium]
MMQQELDALAARLKSQDYISDDHITMSIFLAGQLNRPLLIEGPAGVGKTEIAKVMANLHGTDLIRLQCYEGLDVAHAIYEWNYQKQLLYLKISENATRSDDEKEAEIYSEKYLLKRPLLQAISSNEQVVLLIDEVDRADEEFESFLLEILSDWQVTIPEIGTIKAKVIPFVVLTSNRTRELSEALRRRCFYLWIDYPEFDKELEIVRTKVPDFDHDLARQICRFMMEIRMLDLDKIPGL